MTSFASSEVPAVPESDVVVSSDGYVIRAKKYERVSQVLSRRWKFDTDRFDAKTLAKFDEQREYGTKLHASIEQFFNEETVPASTAASVKVVHVPMAVVVQRGRSVPSAAFMKWTVRHPEWQFVRHETLIWSDNLEIAGRVDAMFWDGSMYVLVDWKTACHVDVYKQHRWKMQLNLYKRVLQDWLQRSVECRMMVVLVHGDLEDAVEIPMEDATKAEWKDLFKRLV